MKFEFVTFNLIEDEGKTSEIPINPFAVLTVLPITVQGRMSGPDGQPIGKSAAGLCAGMKILPVDCSVKEARDKLEAAINKVFDSAGEESELEKTGKED